MSGPIDVTTTAAGIRFGLRVVPRAPRTVIEGVRNGRLLVRVTAPPVESAANEAVVAALALALDVPRRSIRIVSGATGRNKTVDVAGVTESQFREKLLTTSDF